MTALPLAAYPLLFEKMFGSVLAGLLAPVALLAQFRFMPDNDIYWISGWAIVLGIPIVCVALRLNPHRAAIPLVLAAVMASFATSIRSHAGLPVAVAALIVMVWLRTTWRHRALIGVLIRRKVSPTATSFASGRQNLQLIDGNRLVDLLLEHYDDFDPKYKGIIPLRRVFIPELPTEG